MSSTLDVRQFLGLHPEQLDNRIKSTFSNVEGPQIKSYSDAVYFNYFALGLSFLFMPQSGYKLKTGLRRDDLADDKLVLDSIDIYNAPKVKRAGATEPAKSAEAAFSSFPISPLPLFLSAKVDNRPDKFDVSSETTGKDFVACLGEPDRKGGGAGPSSGSIGIWCEWSKDGIMVEFGGDEARGPQAWEKGKDAIWKITTVFSPKSV